jgi:hypothetical protein
VEQAKNIFCIFWDLLPFLGSLVSERKNGLNRMRSIGAVDGVDKLHPRAEF